MTRAYDQACPIARTLDIIGDRWTMLIVRDMLLGVARFSDLLARSPGMPPKVLSSRLKRLMEHGLVEREVYSEHPLRAEYRLTERGQTLRPVMIAIGTWGFQQLFADEPQVRAAIAEALGDRIPEIRALAEAG